MRERIAIIATSSLFPGSSNDEAFWNNLRQGVDSRRDATHAELGADPALFFGRRGERDRLYCLRGGFVQEPGDMRAETLGISRSAFEALDVAQRWSLYVSRRALARAGYLERREWLAKCGIILGALSFPTPQSNAALLPLYHGPLLRRAQAMVGKSSVGTYTAPTSLLPSAGATLRRPASLVAEHLGLGGTHFVLDAACASALYAISLACTLLREKQHDMMLAGAVSAADALFVAMGFSIFQAYPENGPSTPLDCASQGLSSAEGAGVVVLKRLSDALRDGDRVLATVLGTGLSNDGHGKTLLSPNARGQRFAYERAYAEADIPLDSVDYVECHATGTPLGDRTELAALEDFFEGTKRVPRFGSVKGNVGHLLTAAGMASLQKVLMSMDHGVLPATIGIAHAQQSPQGLFGRKNLVTEASPWPAARGQQRRASVSAFGFGGCNAHLVLEHGAAPARPAPVVDPSLPTDDVERSTAITGMALHFGSSSDLQTFEAHNYHARSLLRDLPARRWKGLEVDSRTAGALCGADGRPPRGAYIDSFSFDFLKFRVPPNPHDRPSAQQLLLLKVADAAIRDAGLARGGNVAVIVGMGMDLSIHQYEGRIRLTPLLDQLWTSGNASERAHVEQRLKDVLCPSAELNLYTSLIGNIMASRVSSHWDFTGPAFTVSAEDNSVGRALQIARLMLHDSDLEAVVVAGVDLAGSAESLWLRNQDGEVDFGPASLSLDIESAGFNVGEGAGAIVLERPRDASARGAHPWAVIDALCFKDGGASSDAVLQAAEQAFAESGVTPSDVDYVELAATGFPEIDALELSGLQQAFRDLKPHGCAIGSVKSLIGNTFAASGIASIIRTALCLHHRYLPSVPSWHGPRRCTVNERGPFYLPPRSRAWLRDEPHGPRRASVSSVDRSSASHLLMSEPARRRPAASGSLSAQPLKMLPLPFESREQLEHLLEELSSRLESGATLSALAAGAAQQYTTHSTAPRTAVLLADSQDALRREVGLLRTALRQARERSEVATPSGSYVCFAPLGRESGVTFVYPGAFNSYFDAGQDLFRLFPEAFDYLAEHASRGSEWLNDPLVTPRSMSKLDARELAARTEALLEQPVGAFEQGILLSVLYTDVVRSSFKLQPSSAFGFSMGEISMLYALGVWKRTDAMSKRLRSSPLFTTDLAGPMNTLRRAFGITDPEVDTKDLWSAYTLRTSADVLRNALKREPRLQLVLINSSKSLVIAGERAAARRLIATLGVEAVETALGDVIHCDLVRPHHAEMAALHRLPVAEAPDVRFFSAVGCRELRVAGTDLGKNVADMYCQEVDFERLTRTVYGAGSRIFLELGPRDSCTQFIGETLGDLPHLAVAIDRKGLGSARSLMHALAKLVSHRVELDLSRLFDKEESVTAGPSLIYPVILGGTPLAEGLSDLCPPSPSPHAPVAQSTGAISDRAGVSHAARNIGVAVAMPSTPGSALHSLASSAIVDFDPSASRTSAPRKETVKTMTQTTLTPPAKSATPLSTPSIARAEAAAPAGNVLRKLRADREPGVVWDLRDLTTFAEGSLAEVFGEKFAEIDLYPRRVRLPTTEYLLVSRVTSIDAQPHRYQASSIVTEYDIPRGAWYSSRGQVPWAVAVESGQCDLLLISYLGVDFQNRGQRVYRLLDCTLTFLERLPEEGQTLRYEIKIDSFARHGDTLLFFFHYDCFVGTRLILTMRGGAAGFFSDAELAVGRGVIRSPAEQRSRTETEKKTFTPWLACGKRTFERVDLELLCDGDLDTPFGRPRARTDFEHAFPYSAHKMLMIDRIREVDPTGGPAGLGLLVAEKTLAPEHWYFPCHFKDDQVMAGSLMAEGCSQLLRFYGFFLGMHTTLEDGCFQPLPGEPQRVRCRGQVTPQHGTLEYRVEITELGHAPFPFAKANVDIVLNGKVVVEFLNLGLRVEKRSGPARACASNPGPAAAPSGTTGPASCFPLHVPELDYPAQTVRIPQYVPGEYPVRRPPFRPFPGNPADLNCIPDTLPYTWYHFTEFATGRVANCFGESCACYDDRTPPRTPNTDLQLVTRVVEVHGTRHDLKQKAYCVAEFDCPADAWFLQHSSHPAHLPYSMLMEMALQPCGFISAWMGTTLLAADRDLYFRNLDGTGRFHANLDPRGKTIRNRASLLSTARMGSTIIQQFSFELSIDGQLLYSGTAAFGYFEKHALTHQAGLDKGVRVPPWHASRDDAQPLARRMVTDGRVRATLAATRGPWYRLGGSRLNFVDYVDLNLSGGTHGAGYGYAERTIDRNEWFFPCHFHQDPVMPGSLGIEAMFEMMQTLALEQDLGRNFRNPRFSHPSDVCTWKYRGQITPADGIMNVDVHVTSVRTVDGRVELRANGNLAKDGLRIYEASGLGLSIEEST